jgi:hypothetical protein
MLIAFRRPVGFPASGVGGRRLPARDYAYMSQRDYAIRQLAKRHLQPPTTGVNNPVHFDPALPPARIRTGDWLWRRVQRRPQRSSHALRDRRTTTKALQPPGGGASGTYTLMRIWDRTTLRLTAA